MTQERISYIDLGAGVMILWMILGHAFSTAAGIEISALELWDITDASLIPEGVHAKIGYDGLVTVKGMADVIPNFLFFFMPWFFYKSGQFFVKRSIEDEFVKDWKKLMHQFLFWTAIAYVMLVTFQSIDGVITLRSATYSVVRGLFLNGAIDYNGPLWFLFSLFLVRQIANVLLPRDSDRLYWLKCACILLISFIIALGAYVLKLRLLPLWVANSAAGLFFFTLGYSLRKYETKWWLLVPCVLGYIACCIWGFPDYGMRSNSCGSISSYIITYPAGLAGIVVFNNLCRWVAKYMHYLSLPFEYVGKYAMIIYVSHCLLYTSVARVVSYFQMQNPWLTTLLLILATYAICLPILCYVYGKWQGKIAVKQGLEK